jgi:hypothetical protein
MGMGVAGMGVNGGWNTALGSNPTAKLTTPQFNASQTTPKYPWAQNWLTGK